jgi:ABC-type transport system substrate-binding protein
LLAPAGGPAKPAEGKPAEGQQAAPATVRSADTSKPGATAAPAGQAASGSGAAGTGEAPKKGGNLRVGLYVEASTMDPHLSGSKIDRQVMHNVYEPLVVLGEKLDIKPGLAESWQQPDPRTLVFKLRQGVKFHDGTAFDAEAAKFNVERMQNPDTKSVRRGEIANVDTAEAVDAYTLKLNLKRPDAALLATLTDRAGMMISPAAVQKFGPTSSATRSGRGPSSSSSGLRTIT